MKHVKKIAFFSAIALAAYFLYSAFAKLRSSISNGELLLNDTGNDGVGNALTNDTISGQVRLDIHEGVGGSDFFDAGEG